MNKENPWTLEPWHVRSAFRKAGVTVPESAITMPGHTISGPDMALEGKEFYVTVTVSFTSLNHLKNIKLVGRLCERE